MERLDEEKIELLRRWGEGLDQDEREEMRAAGRAILLLIDEIDRLHVDIWSERTSAQPAAGPFEAVEDELEAPAPDVESSLRARLRRLGRRKSEEPSGLEPEGEPL
jgi:hypothetical protein